MSKIAIVKIGKSQYKVSEGDQITVDHIEGDNNKKVSFDEVILVAEDENIIIGQPYIKDAAVLAVIVDQKKDEKIRVATYKAKSRYRKTKGFRAQLTVLKIEKISISEKKATKSSKPKSKAKKDK